MSGHLEVLGNDDESSRREQAGVAQGYGAGVFRPLTQMPVCERREAGERPRLKEGAHAG